MDKNNKKLIWFGLTISLFFFSIFIFTKKNGQDISASVSPPLPGPIYKIHRTENENKGESKISQIIKIVLEVGEKRYESEIDGEISVYDFMKKLQNEGKINFKEKNYLGMGKFIEELNGIRGYEGKFWIYYVNDKKAKIGISNYNINPGDVVSWKYEKDIN